METDVNILHSERSSFRSCQVWGHFSGAEKWRLEKEAIRGEQKMGERAYQDGPLHTETGMVSPTHLNARFCQCSGATQRPDTPVPKVRQMHLAGTVMRTM